MKSSRGYLGIAPANRGNPASGKSTFVHTEPAPRRLRWATPSPYDEILKARRIESGKQVVMTISDIIYYHRGRAGSNGSWRVEKLDSDEFVGTEYALWHYGTCMMIWRESHRHGTEVLMMSTGNGSVSDQGGMNTAFRVLGLPYYFSRAGGAEIIELCICQRSSFPHQSAPACDSYAS